MYLFNISQARYDRGAAAITAAPNQNHMRMAMTANKCTLTQARLKELLYYDSATGMFSWLVCASRYVSIGDIAGNHHHSGYKYIKINKKLYSAHRLAFLYMEGYFPVQVDHKDHVRDNNRWNNLRSVNHTMNHQNRTINANNTSGFLGVCWNKANKKWTATIQYNGNKIYLGCFKCKKKAIAARQEANIKYGFHENHGK